MNHKTNIRTASTLNILAAIWLIIAPFVLGFTGTAVATSSYIVGILVAVMAFIRVSTPLQAPWMSWVNGVLGVWTLLTPYIFGYFLASTAWSTVITGIIITGLGVWSAGEAHVKLNQRATPY